VNDLGAFESCCYSPAQDVEFLLGEAIRFCDNCGQNTMRSEGADGYRCMSCGASYQVR
jgi:tRNA(Ile2) C34 agmatinyltransferase TiaS